MPSAGVSSVPSVERHLLRGVVGAEAVPGAAAAAGAALAAHRAPVEDDEVPGRDLGDARRRPLSTTPGRLVAEQEREVVVDPALAVVQVGVADAARLHGHHRLAGPRVGDDDALQR